METDVQQRIRERAYAIWLEEGRPHGRDTDHWLRAEQDIAASLTETAPVALAVAAETVPASAPKPKRTTPSTTTAPKKTPAKKAPARKTAAVDAEVIAAPARKAEPAEAKTTRTRRKSSTAPA